MSSNLNNFDLDKVLLGKVIIECQLCYDRVNHREADLEDHLTFTMTRLVP